MNRYGAMARRHWQTFLPSRYAQITDPHAFFTQLGHEIQAEITDRAEQIVHSQPTGTDYTRNRGRWNEARISAEEAVLAERVLLPAEPGSPRDEDHDPDTENPEPTPGQGRWAPMVEDPTDPTWQQLRELDETS